MSSQGRIGETAYGRHQAVDKPDSATRPLFETENEVDLKKMRRRYTRYRQAESGFTLIEVMVVVIILGILAAAIVPKLMSRPDDARLVKAKQDIRTLGSALQLYRLDNFVYPSTEQGLASLVDKPIDEPLPPNWKAGGYIERLPKDPWGNEYQYLNPGVNGEIDIYSLGADGQTGGSGTSADIGNWKLD